MPVHAFASRYVLEDVYCARVSIEKVGKVPPSSCKTAAYLRTPGALRAGFDIECKHIFVKYTTARKICGKLCVGRTVAETIVSLAQVP
jgi:hypothetical protein